jgi:TRAP-type C4-dicarboxylate transport system substrate-binding protein
VNLVKPLVFKVVVALVAIAIPASASAELTCTAEAPCVMRIGSVAPPGTPWAKIVTKLKRRIGKKSGGRLKVKAFLGQALGGEKSIVRRAKKGTLEMIGVSTGALATVVPALNAYELPYLVNSFAQADKVMDATFAQANAVMAKAGFELYFWSENGFRNFATKDRFVKKPADLRGMKMRAQESFVHTEMYKALGAKPNPIPVAQVAEDLANGVVAGYDNTLLYSYAAQWHKNIKYVTESNHIYQPAVIAYNKSWLDSLPADLRALLLEDRERQTKLGRKRIRATNSQFRGLMEKEGVQFAAPSAADRAAMRKATRGVYDVFKQRVGADGQKLLDAILKAR